MAITPRQHRWFSGAALTALLATAVVVPGSPVAAQAASDPAPCEKTIEVSVGTELECVLVAPRRGFEGTGQWSLSGAPVGMAAQPDSGYLHWTPTPDQVGTYRVLATYPSGMARNLLVTVNPSDVTPPRGIYVSPTGLAGASGTAADPLGDLQEAVERATAGETIYVRGGLYVNPQFGEPFTDRESAFVRIDRKVGSPDTPYTLRNYGNEYATLRSDVNAVLVRQSQWWTIRGLQVEGIAATQTIEGALQDWWAPSSAATAYGARGIAMNNSRHITVEDSVIHHFPGAGMSNNGGSYVTSRRNVIYDNAWYSTAGTHGFANSSPASEPGDDPEAVAVAMIANLVFGNQSSNISHVFGKGAVTLAIDEGNGLHMQNNGGSFVGTFLAEDNVAAYNGKAGLGLNTVDDSTIRRNSFFHNSAALAGNGELSIQSSRSRDISRNLFHPAPGRVTIRDFQSSFAGVRDNYTVAVDGDRPPTGVSVVAGVFTDPERGDFTPAAGIASGYGASPTTLTWVGQRVAELGLEIGPAPDVVDEDYVETIRRAILSSWPDPADDPSDSDGVPNDLVLRVPGTDGADTCYTYATRAAYPGPSGTACR